ncbi:hypothetical protein KBD45_01760 [Candidatus Dojkabacteria bacterium]|nr:hypothetical protein [Candidatus Dojkabacteria bacterium]
MKEKLKETLLKIGFSEIDASDLSVSIIILSLKQVLENLLDKEDFDKLDQEIQNKNYEVLNTLIQKVDKDKFQIEMAERIKQNLIETMDVIFNEVPEELKQGFVEILSEIKTSEFVDKLKNSNEKIEDVLKNIAQ